MSAQIAFVTNICTHYTQNLFQRLQKKYCIDYYFTDGGGHYRNDVIIVKQEAFDGFYLKSFPIFSKFRICPKLFRLIFSKNKIFIKSTDDRFALFVVILNFRWAENIY